MIICDSCKHFFYKKEDGFMWCGKYMKRFDNGFHAKRFAKQKDCKNIMAITIDKYPNAIKKIWGDK